MSEKIDWAKYVSEIEQKMDSVEISNRDEPKKKAEVSDKPQRKDPGSPLHSIKSFEELNLDPNLLKGVYEMGINAPSKIQETALPVLLADPPQNLIAQSQPGTGKTTAFALAMLSRVDVTKKYPQVLCLLPTFELAIQTGEVVAHMAKFCPEIEMKYAVDGELIERHSNLTEHIIIGTPRKVLDWAVKFRAFDLKKICTFVLNEADVMISMQGHQDQCIRIHKNLNFTTCQMIFFLTIYDQQVMDFAELITKNPIIIRLKGDLDNIRQYYVRCKSPGDKYTAITNIYSKVGTGQAIIIFCNTRRIAQWLFEKMSKDGHAVVVLSGNLSVEERINVLDIFREGKAKVLIATNILSHAIHVGQVTIVVNFDLPMDMNGRADCDTYLCRIGRTERFRKSGVAINLVDSGKDMGVCKAIERHFDRQIHLLDTNDSDEIEKVGNMK